MSQSASKPTISVIIPTFNRAHYLGECLDGFLQQTLPPAQIVVVNDGSTDETGDVLARYAARYAVIEAIETSQQGKARAIERGMREVRGDYVWFFDDDDVALPDALERCVAPLEEHPEYGFSFASFYFSVDRPGSTRIGRVVDELKIPDLETRGPLIPLLEANYLGGATIFARTSVYEEVGLYDPQLIRSVDYEMAIRITRAFRGIRVPGGPVYHYRQHDLDRGSDEGRFAGEERWRKWLEYDQQIFRKLYRELPLGDYLPPPTPRTPLERNRRRALLQRLAVMASKHLASEVVEDMRQLVALGGDEPLDSAEDWIVRRRITRVPYYGVGRVFDDPEVDALLRELSTQSACLQELRDRLAMGRGSTLTARMGARIRTWNRARKRRGDRPRTSPAASLVRDL